MEPCPAVRLSLSLPTSLSLPPFHLSFSPPLPSLSLPPSTLFLSPRPFHNPNRRPHGGPEGGREGGREEGREGGRWGGGGGKRKSTRMPSFAAPAARTHAHAHTCSHVHTRAVNAGNTPFEVARIVQQSQSALQTGRFPPAAPSQGRRGVELVHLSAGGASGGSGGGGGGGGGGAGAEMPKSTMATLRHVYETKGAAGLFLGIQARVGQVCAGGEGGGGVCAIVERCAALRDSVLGYTRCHLVLGCTRCHLGVYWDCFTRIVLLVY